MRATSVLRHLLLFLPCCQAAVFEASFATVTKAPEIAEAALYERSNPTVCGFYNGNSASPDSCGAPHICQWSTSTGYPGQMICQTNGYTVSLAPYCVNSGAPPPVECAGTQATLCATCASSLYPYCQTLLFASGPGQQIQYTSGHCRADNLSPTAYLYYEPTSDQAAATSTTPATTTTTPAPISPSPSPISHSPASISPSPASTSPSPAPTSPSSLSSPKGLTAADIAGIAVSSVVALMVIITLGLRVEAFRRWLINLWNCFCCCFEKEVPPKHLQAASTNSNLPELVQPTTFNNMDATGPVHSNYR